MNWLKDKTKQISIIRTIIQLLFLFLIFYVSIVAVWKGLLLVIIIGSTLLLGRLFCGWVCPLGLYQDMMTLLRRSLRIRHWLLPRKVNEDLHKARYLIAMVILVVVLSATLFATSFDVGNVITLRSPFTPFALLLEPLQPIVLPWHPPFGALAGVGGVYLTFPYVGEILLYLRDTGIALPLSYLFGVAVLTASFKARRFWCRFCPTGLSLAALNRFKEFRWAPLLSLNKNGEKCTKCGICSRVCPVQVTEVYEKKTGAVDTSMCMLCLRCVEMCPEKDCLSLGIVGRCIRSSQNWLETEA